MTLFEVKHIKEETNIEYEMLHTNFIGNKHLEEDTLDKAIQNTRLD